MVDKTSTEVAIAAGAALLAKGGKRKGSKLAQLDVETRIRVIGTQQVMAAELASADDDSSLQDQFLAWLREYEPDTFNLLIEQWVASA